MIKGLKRNFVFMCTLCAFVLLFVVLLCVNLLYLKSIVSEADRIIDYISFNGGRFPTGGEHIPPEEDAPPAVPQTNPSSGSSTMDDSGEEKPKLPHGMSPELAYQIRYFSIDIEEDESISLVDLHHIAAIDRDSAIEHAFLARGLGNTRGFLGQYRFSVNQIGHGERIIFLDCQMQLDSFFVSLVLGIIIGIFGLLLVAIVAMIVSGRILRPIYESYEKQRDFIADASHELKTPITIISANVELLEMEYGNSESLDDIRSQVERMTEMTRDLILLARMEQNNQITRIEFPMSEVVNEAVAGFRSRIATKRIELSTDIKPLITFKGDSRAIMQLVGVLLDNAIKYTEHGISVRLYEDGRGVLFAVENDISEPIDRATLDRLFDRFYRADPSRNSTVGGYGIGLSVAKAIVDSHGGRISAECPSPNKFRITVNL